jgi:hypothetical protein
MEAINDSLKNVAKSAELVKEYLESKNLEDDLLLRVALDLLEKTVELLSKSVA